MKAKLIEQFKEIFGTDEEVRAYFAPGRVQTTTEVMYFRVLLQSVHMQL